MKENTVVAAGKRRRWTAPDNHRLSMMYLEGKSIRSICKLLNRTGPAVRNQLYKLGLANRFKARDDEFQEQVRNLHKEGWGDYQIAGKLQVNASSVKVVRRLLGLVQNKTRRG